MNSAQLHGRVVLVPRGFTLIEAIGGNHDHRRFVIPAVSPPSKPRVNQAGAPSAPVTSAKSEWPSLSFESARTKLPTGGKGTDKTTKQTIFANHSLFTHLLPFIDQLRLYNKVELAVSYRAPAQSQDHDARLRALRLPQQSVQPMPRLRRLRPLRLCRHRLHRYRSRDRLSQPIKAG